ncbi:MAG: M23 family metallopeptidase, partial [Candidatus Aminicenantes bacterium]|nr:M23 family metallopeptidase [Candidatus Aminicenantes bacterium]
MLKVCSILLWLLPVLFFAEEVQVEKYRWPLNINNGCSSSFQEFRNNHFHAGIDLRTYQKTGYPVYALADSKVVKIRVVKRGSGRGLYLKHHDGHTSIFFHLDRFIPALEKIVKRVQGATGKKYFGNYDLKNPFPVKKDDLIAYSGETGYGFPHLHLEIRDPQYRAVNPFKLIRLPANDSNFPVLRSLLLRNKSESLINGRVGESWFKFNRASDSLYYLKEPLVVTGKFDLLLNARDISDTGKYVAPYEISLYINDCNTFCLRFDRFAWEDNNQLGFVYDMFYSSSGNFFYNLFFQNGFEMEMNKLDLDS